MNTTAKYQFDSKLNRATCREQYVASWQDHIKQLSALVLSAYDDLGAAAETYRELKEILFEITERAADRAFPMVECPYCGEVELPESGGECGNCGRESQF